MDDIAGDLAEGDGHGRNQGEKAKLKMKNEKLKVDCRFARSHLGKERKAPEALFFNFSFFIFHFSF
jgi:hypothetical protein